MTAHRFTHRSAIRRAAAAVVAATAAVSLAACGGDDGSAGHSSGHDRAGSSASAPASQGKHNAADVSFAQGMIPHHRQAVEMARLAESRASSSAVKKLAENVEKAQAPEIETMSGWLADWDEKVPAEGEGMDHAGHDMPGMMDPGDMDRLEKSSGKAFDAAFLQMMIDHHEGAVEMAEDEKADGAYAPAKKMADDVIVTQTAEIKQMNKLLGNG